MVLVQGSKSPSRGTIQTRGMQTTDREGTPQESSLTSGNDKDNWKFSLHTTIAAPSASTQTQPSSAVPPEHVVNAFRTNGFHVFPTALSLDAVQILQDRLEEVLRGRYNRGGAGGKPDKSPRLLRNEYYNPSNNRNSSSVANDDGHATIQTTNNNNNNGTETTTTNNNQTETADSHAATSTKTGSKTPADAPCRRRRFSQAAGPLGFSGNFANVKVLQLINVHKADQAFRDIATHPALGCLVAHLAGWPEGARLAQDQVWAKPPHAPSLAFHRDSPYFMFTPDSVMTVWIALDDMDQELGPLEYVKGSHLWGGDGTVGLAGTFFGDTNQTLVQSAAERAGIDASSSELDIVSMKGLRAGGLSIHDGRTWHGSGKNQSKCRPRRGLGLHFVPNNVRFTAKARKSSLWKSYVVDSDDDDLHLLELPSDDFPSVWTPSDDDGSHRVQFQEG